VADRPRVEVEPGIRFGYPHVRGVSVEVLGGQVFAGDSVDEVADDYPYMSRGHVLLACWYLGMHGSKAWVRRWRMWAVDVYVLLARDRPDYSAVPDPPTKEES
jgi:uncharacterized protein (DUF433 family)